MDIASTRGSGSQGLTAVVGFDKGFVHPPAAAMQVHALPRKQLTVGDSADCVLSRCFTYGGRAAVTPTRGDLRAVRSAGQLTPGECGTLVDNEAAMRDITATLVDFAVKGYLTIEQKEESHLLGLTHSKDYIFHLKKPPAEWTSARSHEAGNAFRAF